MKGKIITTIVITLLIATTVSSVAGNMNIEKEQGLVEPVYSYESLPQSSPRPLQLPPFILRLFNPDWNTWDSAPNMFADTVGNVGIGCLNPPFKFSVFADIYDYAAYINNNKGDGLYVESKEGIAIVAKSGNRPAIAVDDCGCCAFIVYNTAHNGLYVINANQSGIRVDNAGDYGIYVQNAGIDAGFFDGDVTVTGMLAKGGGSFLIDHPLDPANKYLYHSFVESPDMKNVYDGVVVLDINGEATVELPDYFETLNKDFRYQLTCIGDFAPVYISEEISNNAFKIAGGKPAMKVSWQVTGIRHDPFANANRIQVEVDKPAEEMGKYLHPELYDLSEEYGIHYGEYQ